MAVAVIGAMAWVTRRYFMDDAFIGFHYLTNLLSGRGFTFNPGERVEGITNIGWVLSLIPLASILTIPAAAKIMGLFLASATVIIAYALARALGRDGGAIAAAPVPLLIACNFDYAYLSLAGMETALLSALLLAAAWLTMIDRRRWLVGLLLALAFLCHPESALIFPLFIVLVAALRRQELRGWLPSFGLFAGAVALFTLARYSYFHDLLPQTFYAKPAGIKDVIKSGLIFMKGWDTNFIAPWGGIFVIMFALAGGITAYRSAPRAALFLAAAAMAGAAFAVYAPQDWTFLGRYFAPYLPAAVILSWKGVIETHEAALSRIMDKRRIGWLLAAYAVAISASGLADAAMHLRKSYVERYPGYVLTSARLEGPALWIRDYVPDGAVIATRRIGAVAFYSRKKIFDWKFGLIDREVAAVVRRTPGAINFPTHPALAELWAERSPDFLLEDSHVIAVVLRETGGSEDRFEVHGVPYHVIRKFPIGLDVDWVLCQKME